ncbi:hypothetical protein EIP91_009541 [Steccherinum ochraceum]|uniref:Uncharacterized protein n=1 Tax=Steccherinum ochraceum TaxID=92696 RepID=A0A4R0R1H6_9APHY|nr:hypothetical protein EIP91_009541 [Steccherinum ochraceum]
MSTKTKNATAKGTTVKKRANLRSQDPPDPPIQEPHEPVPEQAQPAGDVATPTQPTSSETAPESQERLDNGPDDTNGEQQDDTTGKPSDSPAPSETGVPTGVAVDGPPPERPRSSPEPNVSVNYSTPALPTQPQIPETSGYMPMGNPSYEPMYAPYPQVQPPHFDPSGFQHQLDRLGSMLNQWIGYTNHQFRNQHFAQMQAPAPVPMQPPPPMHNPILKEESPSSSTIWQASGGRPGPTDDSQDQPQNTTADDVEEMYADPLYAAPPRQDTVSGQSPRQVASPTPQRRVPRFGPSHNERLARANLPQVPEDAGGNPSDGSDSESDDDDSNPGSRNGGQVPSRDGQGNQDRQPTPGAGGGGASGGAGGGGGPPGGPPGGGGNDGDESSHGEDDDDYWFTMGRGSRRRGMRGGRGRASSSRPSDARRSQGRRSATADHVFSTPQYHPSQSPFYAQDADERFPRAHHDITFHPTDIVVEMAKPLERAVVYSQEERDTTKLIKPSAPDKYGGENDIDKFILWFTSVVRFCQLSRITGPQHDNYRTLILGQWLKDGAAKWYADYMRIPDDPRNPRTFVTVACDLYMRFVQRNSTQYARDKFDTVHYTTEGGITALVMELMTAASQMVERPTNYQIRSRVWGELPAWIRRILGRNMNISPEKSKLAPLVDAVKEIENYDEDEKALKKAMAERTRTADSKQAANGGSSEQQSEKKKKKSSKSKGKEKEVNRTSDGRFVSQSSTSQTQPQQTQPKYFQRRTFEYRPFNRFKQTRFVRSGTQQSAQAQRPADTRTFSASAKPRDKSKDTCNACGGIGHWKGDPGCPGPRHLRRMDEIVDDRSDAGGEQSRNAEEQASQVEGDQYQPDDQDAYPAEYESEGQWVEVSDSESSDEDDKSSQSEDDTQAEFYNLRDEYYEPQERFYMMRELEEYGSSSEEEEDGERDQLMATQEEAEDMDLQDDAEEFTTELQVAIHNSLQQVVDQVMDDASVDAEVPQVGTSSETRYVVRELPLEPEEQSAGMLRIQITPRDVNAPALPGELPPLPPTRSITPLPPPSVPPTVTPSVPVIRPREQTNGITHRHVYIDDEVVVASDEPSGSQEQLEGVRYADNLVNQIAQSQADNLSRRQLTFTRPSLFNSDDGRSILWHQESPPTWDDEPARNLPSLAQVTAVPTEPWRGAGPGALAPLPPIRPSAMTMLADVAAELADASGSSVVRANASTPLTSNQAGERAVQVPSPITFAPPAPQYIDQVAELRADWNYHSEQRLRYLNSGGRTSWNPRRSTASQLGRATSEPPNRPANPDGDGDSDDNTPRQIPVHTSAVREDPELEEGEILDDDVASDIIGEPSAQQPDVPAVLTIPRGPARVPLRRGPGLRASRESQIAQANERILRRTINTLEVRYNRAVDQHRSMQNELQQQLRQQAHMVTDMTEMQRENTRLTDLVEHLTDDPAILGEVATMRTRDRQRRDERENRQVGWFPDVPRASGEREPLSDLYTDEEDMENVPEVQPQDEDSPMPSLRTITDSDAVDQPASASTGSESEDDVNRHTILPYLDHRNQLERSASASSGSGSSAGPSGYPSNEPQIFMVTDIPTPTLKSPDWTTPIEYTAHPVDWSKFGMDRSPNWSSDCYAWERKEDVHMPESLELHEIDEDDAESQIDSQVIYETPDLPMPAFSYEDSIVQVEHGEAGSQQAEDQPRRFVTLRELQIVPRSPTRSPSPNQLFMLQEDGYVYRASVSAKSPGPESERDPRRPRKRGRCMTCKIMIDGHEALALWDTGSTMEAVNAAFIAAHGIKAFELLKVLQFQMGCSGSRGKINYGCNVKLGLGSRTEDVYFDVINLDHYDVVLGVGFLTQVGAILNFKDGFIQIDEEIFRPLPPPEPVEKTSRAPRGTAAKYQWAHQREDA